MITFLLVGVDVTSRDSCTHAVIHTSRDTGGGGWEHLGNNLFFSRMLRVHIVST